MLENYLNQMNIRIEDVKNYIYTIDKNYDESLEKCFMMKQIKENIYKRKDYYVELALKALFNVKGVNTIEYHLIMINYLFKDEDKVINAKKKIKKIVLHFIKPIHIYQLLRHIMSINNTKLIELLVKHNYLNKQEAAYCMLVEENIHEAYMYLYSMEDKPNKEILEYLYTYSPIGYYKLVNKFKHKTSLTLAFN